MGFFDRGEPGGFDPFGLLGGGGDGGGDGPDVPRTPAEILQDALSGLISQGPQLQQLRRTDIESQLSNLTEFGPQFQDQITGLRDTQAQADIFRAAQLAPQIRAIEDPTTRGVRETLGQQVQEELQRGDALPPGVIRELQQGVRGAQAARGVRFGARPIAEEAFTVGIAAEQRAERRRVSRQQLALEFLRTQATTQVEPIATVANLAAGASQPLNQLQQQGLGESLLGGVFGVSAQQSNLQAQQQFNTQQLQAQQQQQRQAGIFGLLGGAAGFAFGGLGGAAVGSKIGSGLSTIF